MTAPALSVPVQLLRRVTGSGAPSTLKAGQALMNEVEGILYIGTGDNGAGISTAQIAIAGPGIIGMIDAGANAATPVTPVSAVFTGAGPVDLGNCAGPRTRAADLGRVGDAAGAAIDLGRVSS